VYFAWLMPCLRRIRATGTRASPSFSIATTSDSPNLRYFIGLSSAICPAREVQFHFVYGARKLTEADDFPSSLKNRPSNACRSRGRKAVLKLVALVGGDHFLAISF
jgi:hypothetical protein